MGKLATKSHRRPKIARPEPKQTAQGVNWYRRLKQQELARKAKPASNGQRRIVVSAEEQPRRFIIIPRKLGSDPVPASRTLAALSSTRTANARVGVASQPCGLSIIDSVSEHGPKLVEMTSQAAMAFRSNEANWLLVPEVFYRPAVSVVWAQHKPEPTTTVRVAKNLPGQLRMAKKSIKFSSSAATPKMLIRVLDSQGKPMAGVALVIFSDFAARVGLNGVTNAKGEYAFPTAGFSAIDRLYVLPSLNYWSYMATNVQLAASIDITPRPLALDYTDCLRYFYGNGADRDGAGVRVGVIDTGIATDHPDLVVAGGKCTIPGQNPADFGALGGEHGTHVAGIIAARGTPPNGIRGVAPGVELYSYRVFNAGEDASNYAINRAIDAAVQQGCDLINMSLSGGPRDSATEDAIDKARRAGCLCIVAAGNEDHSPVGQPAAYSQCVAVSACGRKGTFPIGTADAGDIAPPHGTDPADFLAAFSNVGPEIDVIGPGVGVISTVPGGYLTMSGTSMATPAVVGLCARLLSQPANAAILNAARDLNRADAIAKMLFASCAPLGLGYNQEGHGMPRP